MATVSPTLKIQTRETLGVLAAFAAFLLLAVTAGAFVAWLSLPSPIAGKAPALVRLPVVTSQLRGGGTASAEVTLAMQTPAQARQVAPISLALQSSVARSLSAQSLPSLSGAKNIERFRVLVEEEVDATLQGRKLPLTQQVFVESLVSARRDPRF